jgi:hypothetical protein
MTDRMQKAEEESRRERHWDPAVRWRVIQDMIAWADAQQPIPRNSREACLREQRRKLAEQTGG